MAAGKFNMQKASGGIASITVADGVGATNIVLPESGTVATTDNIVGFKNYIINGNFDIWQYGASQTTSGYGSADRWISSNVGSTKTHSQITCTDTERALFNATYFSRTVVSSVAGVGNFVLKQQLIENVTKTAGKTVTISFWAKANSSKNIEVKLFQTFGTGGSPSSYITNIGQQLVSLTNTWQKKTITISIPSIVGKTLGTDGVHTTSFGIRFIFDAGSGYDGSIVGQQSGTFDIAQVQLEEGSVATPFENRPIGLELSLCQRYYEVIIATRFFWIGAAGIEDRTSYNFRVIKRTVPSVTLGTIVSNNVTSVSSLNNYTDALQLKIIGANAGSSSVDGLVMTASAEL